LHFGHAAFLQHGGALLRITVIGTFAGMDFSEIELGPKMQACSERERKFVWFYITDDDGNASEAARKAGYADPGGDNPTIRVRAHALMHRERVLAAIEEVGKKAFRGLLIPAVRATKKLIDSEKHPDHAKTVSSTLARLGITERTGVDVSVSGEITHNHTDAALNDLRALLALQVPREKLIEIFGFSGLSRYEKMLAEADAKAGRLIEHKADEVTNG
jgi:phage terminase small subunit